MDGKTIDTMRRILLSILLMVSLCVQAENLFEMGIHGGAGSWAASTDYIHPQMGLQGGAHLYYNYLSESVFGFRLGVTVDHHALGWRKTDYQDSYSTIDVEGQQMDIAYSIGNLQEQYAIWSVGVPVQVALSYKGIMLFAGGKASFPLANTWKQSVQNAALSVYYPAYDNCVYESYPLAASRDFAMSQEGELQLPKVQWWVATELSYAIPLNRWARNYRSYLIVGAYFDYCLSRYTPSHSDAESLIMLSDTRDGFPLKRLLTPIMEANRQGSPLVNSCALFDIGVKISYAISPHKAYRRASHPCNCLGVW